MNWKKSLFLQFLDRSCNRLKAGEEQHGRGREKDWTQRKPDGDPLHDQEQNAKRCGGKKMNPPVQPPVEFASA
jgi:hypothetical protein